MRCRTPINWLLRLGKEVMDGMGSEQIRRVGDPAWNGNMHRGVLSGRSGTALGLVQSGCTGCKARERSKDKSHGEICNLPQNSPRRNCGKNQDFQGAIFARRRPENRPFLPSAAPHIRSWVSELATFQWKMKTGSPFESVRPCIQNVVWHEKAPGEAPSGGAFAGGLLALLLLVVSGLAHECTHARSEGHVTSAATDERWRCGVGAAATRDTRPCAEGEREGCPRPREEKECGARRGAGAGRQRRRKGGHRHTPTCTQKMHDALWTLVVRNVHAAPRSLRSWKLRGHERPEARCRLVSAWREPIYRRHDVSPDVVVINLAHATTTVYSCGTIGPWERKWSCWYRTMTVDAAQVDESTECCTQEMRDESRAGTRRSAHGVLENGEAAMCKLPARPGHWGEWVI
ncbi:hypothetical protein FB451DRAFT_1178030 [Mycena latifolia]|nr:hypothetical protein FB451DRAFT_1178030 [Mycena latifolia]